MCEWVVGTHVSWVLKTKSFGGGESGGSVEGKRGAIRVGQCMRRRNWENTSGCPLLPRPPSPSKHVYLKIFVSSHWSVSQTNKKIASAETKPLARQLRRQGWYKKKRGEKRSLLSRHKLSPPLTPWPCGSSDNQAMLCDVAPLDPPTHTHTHTHTHAHTHTHTHASTPHTICYGVSKGCQCHIRVYGVYIEIASMPKIFVSKKYDYIYLTQHTFVSYVIHISFYVMMYNTMQVKFVNIQQPHTAPLQRMMNNHNNMIFSHTFLWHGSPSSSRSAEKLGRKSDDGNLRGLCHNICYGFDKSADGVIRRQQLEDLTVDYGDESHNDQHQKDGAIPQEQDMDVDIDSTSSPPSKSLKLAVTLTSIATAAVLLQSSLSGSLALDTAGWPVVEALHLDTHTNAHARTHSAHILPLFHTHTHTLSLTHTHKRSLSLPLADLSFSPSYTRNRQS